MIAVGIALGVGAATAQPLPEAPGSTIGYATVAAALQALRTRPDIVISVQGGWTIAEDGANQTLWSFAPEGNSAYPAAVKRQIKKTKDGIYIDMQIRCEATKEA